METEHQHQPLTLGRACLALLAGAASGGVLVAVPLTVWTLIFWPDPALPGGIIEQSLSYALGTFLILGIGLLIIGAPLWAWLHGHGYRGWRSAVTLGAVTTFGVLFFLSGWNRGSWTDAVIFLGWLTASGGLVGLIIWRVAYQQPLFPKIWRR